MCDICVTYMWHKCHTDGIVWHIVTICRNDLYSRVLLTLPWLLVSSLLPLISLADTSGRIKVTMRILMIIIDQWCWQNKFLSPVLALGIKLGCGTNDLTQYVSHLIVYWVSLMTIIVTMMLMRMTIIIGYCAINVSHLIIIIIAHCHDHNHILWWAQTSLWSYGLGGHFSHHHHCDHVIVIIIIVMIIIVILIIVIMSSITDQVGPCIAALLARPVYARVIGNVAPGVENVAPGDVGKEGKKKEEWRVPVVGKMGRRMGNVIFVYCK